MKLLVLLVQRLLDGMSPRSASRRRAEAMQLLRLRLGGEWVSRLGPACVVLMEVELSYVLHAPDPHHQRHHGTKHNTGPFARSSQATSL